jgi:hypothetical protein
LPSGHASNQTIKSVVPILQKRIRNTGHWSLSIGQKMSSFLGCQGVVYLSELLVPGAVVRV